MYTISHTDLNNSEVVTNLTVANMSDTFLIDTDQFLYWFDDNIDLEDHQDYDENDDLIPLDSDEVTTIKLDNVDEFKSSDAFVSLSDEYCSMSDVLYIL